MAHRNRRSASGLRAVGRLVSILPVIKNEVSDVRVTASSIEYIHYLIYFESGKKVLFSN